MIQLQESDFRMPPQGRTDIKVEIVISTFVPTLQKHFLSSLAWKICLMKDKYTSMSARFYEPEKATVIDFFYFDLERNLESN